MKNIKKILCVALTVLICFSLIGCNVIDKMRLAQIHFNENDNLIYDDKEYKLLPPCSPFSPDTTNEASLYITEEDVPVLLSSILGDWATITEDNLFIITTDDYYNSNYYACTDVYDSIASRIESGNYFDGFCFNYEVYDAEADKTYQTKRSIIPEKTEEVVKKIVATGTPEDIDIDLMYPYEVLQLYACSNDLYFQEYAATVYQTEQHIYLAAAMNGRFESETVFMVTEEYTEIFTALINSYHEAEVTYDEWWAEYEE